ncbi:MAG: hypothetical protein ACR2HY_08990 [Acidimicrobiales bacterium]
MPRRQASAFSGRALTTTTRRAPAPVAPADARADAEADRSRRVRRSRLALFGFVLACYLSAPNVTNTDAYLAVPTAVSIVHSANLTLDEFHNPLVRKPQGFVTLHGHRFDRFPWADALFFLPGVVVMDVLGHLGVGHGATALVESNTMGPLQLATASLVTALVAIVVSAVAYERLGGSATARRRASVAVGAVFALGTSAWSTASRSLWQHGPSMLALGLALLAASRLERGHRPAVMAAALGAAVAAAYALRPTNAIAVVGFGLLVAVRHRGRLGAWLGGLVAVLVPFVAVNVASYGRVLPPYFSAGRLSLHPDYLEALAANLLSPARGLLVFCPVVALSVAGVVLQIRRRALRPLEAVAAGCIVVQLLVVSAQNEGWWGGHAFGPRFMTDVLPLLAYLSVPAVEALIRALRAPAPSALAKAAAGATAVAVVMSVAVNAEGAYLRSSTCWNARPVNIDRKPSRVWDLRDPQILAGYRAVARDGLRTAMLGPCVGADTFELGGPSSS